MELNLYKTWIWENLNICQDYCTRCAKVLIGEREDKTPGNGTPWIHFRDNFLTGGEPLSLPFDFFLFY